MLQSTKFVLSPPIGVSASIKVTYAKAGLVSYGDWLGTRNIAYRYMRYRPFKEARAFVHRLGLKSKPEWVSFCKAGKKPADIPAKPDNGYADNGWAGWGDWLGTGTVDLREFRNFKEARTYVRGLGLKTGTEWHEYCNSGKKPKDIPSNPNQVYKNSAWAGLGDWLGTGRIADKLRKYRPFKDARKFVHGFGLKSSIEWRDYCKSGKKPADIPAKPDHVYRHSGWTGWGDWLGYARNTHPPKRSQMVDPAVAPAEGNARGSGDFRVT